MKKRNWNRVWGFLFAIVMMIGSISIPSSKVEAATRSIVLAKTAISLEVGKTAQIQVKKVNGLNSKKVSYCSLNKAVATVTSTGKVKAVKVGTTMVKVTSAVDKRVVKNVKVTVKKANAIRLSFPTQKRKVCHYELVLPKEASWEKVSSTAGRFYAGGMGKNGTQYGIAEKDCPQEEGAQLLQTMKDAEKELCKTARCTKKIVNKKSGDYDSVVMCIKNLETDPIQQSGISLLIRNRRPVQGRYHMLAIQLIGTGKEVGSKMYNSIYASMKNIGVSMPTYAEYKAYNSK